MPKYDATKIISGKDLGQLALESFCSRCFWLERYLGKPPSIFPGIFSTLDALSKRSTKRSFSERNCLPNWLVLDNIVKPVSFSRINAVTEYGWILTGDPDDIFELTDKSHHVVDYKTSKFTERQDMLYPMYEVQLNAYAFSLPHQGIKPVSKLSLIYCEPQEELDSDEEFRLTFGTHSLEIPIRTELIPELLIRARKIIDNTTPPVAKLNCKGICSWIERLLNFKL